MLTGIMASGINALNKGFLFEYWLQGSYELYEFMIVEGVGSTSIEYGIVFYLEH